MAEQRITVKEIARLAEVSIGTVDRVLHDRGRVSPATKEKVEAIIRSTGYQPDVLARQLKLNRHWVVRVLMPRSDQDSGYWRLCRDGIETAAARLANNRVSVDFDEFDRYDRTAARRLVARAAADFVDGLLVAPIASEELLPALRALGEGIPYAFFDGSLDGAAPVASLGQDPLRAGFFAGRMLDLLARGTGPFVAINAHAEDGHIRRRIEGFRSFFESGSPRPSREILVREYFDLELPSSRERSLTGLFDDRPDISGILVANASGHIVGDWLASCGRKAECVLISWDLVPANEEGLRSGGIDCVISQRPEEQGRLGLELLARSLMYGEDVSTKVHLPIDVWLKENLPPKGPY